jgi:O-antigen/teichoic acid export membrane protein
MIGASAAGIYGFSYSIYSIISITGTSIDHAFAPWFYEKMENKEYSDIKKYSKDISFGMLLLSIIAILFAPEAIKILGSEDYWEGVYTAIPLVVAGYFSFMYLIPSCVEYYYAKTKYIALGTSMAAVLNILLNYFFIKRFGYIAASYTTLFTYVLYFLFHYFMAWRIHGNSLFDTTAFLTYSLIIIAVNFLAIQLIPFWYVRWIIGIILGIFLFKWIDSRFNIMRHIRSKVFH